MTFFDFCENGMYYLMKMVPPYEIPVVPHPITFKLPVYLWQKSKLAFEPSRHVQKTSCSFMMCSTVLDTWVAPCHSICPANYWLFMLRTSVRFLLLNHLLNFMHRGSFLVFSVSNIIPSVIFLSRSVLLVVLLIPSLALA